MVVMVPHQHFLSPRERKNASQRARLHIFWIPTSDTLNKAYLEEWLYADGDSSEEQNVIDFPVRIRQGARQLKRERSEGTMASPMM